MGLIIDGVSALDLILDGQSVSLYVGGTPPVKVWPNVKEVVQITLGTGYEARDQFQAALSARGLDHTAITEIPFEIELVGSGSAKYMFSFCISLTTVPDLDTSGVTDMGLMFVNCRSLTHAPNMDTSQVTNMSKMFQGCSALTSVPDMDTAKVTNVSNMFRDCRSLTDGNVRLIGRNPSVTTTNMITGSGLTREPFIEVVQITLGTGVQARDQFQAALSARGLNYQTVTEIPFDIELVGSGSAIFMFNGCSALTSVPDMDTSNVTIMNSMFQNCPALTSVPDMDTAKVTSMNFMFNGCASLTSVPDMDTAKVTNMRLMFQGCSALTSVPDMDTAKVTNMNSMFRDCSSLTDGNVRLIGRNPSVTTTNMITGSGLTREPFYNTAGNPI